MTLANNSIELQSNNISSILICADSEFALACRNAILNLTSNCEITLLTDPSQIMPLLLECNFDLLLLDIDMPNLNGEAFTVQIREHFSAVELPILIITNMQLLEKRNAVLVAGANDYLSKPFDCTEVSIRIKNHLTLRNFHKTTQAIQNDLGREVRARTAKLDMLINSGLMMSMERSHTKLLNHILVEGQRLLNCDGGTMYFVTKQKSLRFAVRTKDDKLPFLEIPLYDPETGKANDHYVSVYAAIHNKTVVIDDVYQETHFDCSGTRAFDTQCGYRTISLLTVPMVPRNDEVIGILQFMNALDPDTGAIIPFPGDIITLIESLAAQAAVALDNLQLVEGQKATMENIIRLLAAAVDSNSGDLFTYFGKQRTDKQVGFL